MQKDRGETFAYFLCLLLIIGIFLKNWINNGCCNSYSCSKDFSVPSVLKVME